MISSNSIHISDIYTKPLGGELERIEEENDELVENIDIPKKKKATKTSEKRNKVKKVESKPETNSTFKIIENDKKMKIKRETPGKKGRFLFINFSPSCIIPGLYSYLSISCNFLFLRLRTSFLH